mgnify:CR=1 FL=1
MKHILAHLAPRSLTWLLAASLAITTLHAETRRIVSLRELAADVPADQLDGNVSLSNTTLHSQKNRPRVNLPSGSRAYLAPPENDEENRWSISKGDLRVALELADEQAIVGTLILPSYDDSAEKIFPFTFDPAAHEPATREAFDAIRQAHYQHLADARFPGAAWFRHRAGNAQPTPGNRRRNNLDATYELFTGSRAIAENLALDRELILGNEKDGEHVALDSIQGVTVREIDWTEMLEPTETAIDPLAHYIPHDQHAIIIPSMPRLFSLLDTLESDGIPILQSFDVRNEYRGLATRYRHQMGLDVPDALAAKLPIDRVAITGGDPFFPTGTDVAVLLETQKPDALFKALRATLALKAKLRDAKPIDDATAWESPDRSFSTHLIKLDKAVVIANSAAQIERIRAVLAKKTPALGSLDEYRFFRQRYPLGEAESAYLFFSDPTIRRWVGPRMRIAASRRTRALAALSELTAQHVDGLELPDTYAPLLGKTRVHDSTIHSENFLTIPFLKPISEMSLDRVTPAEAEAYDRWRTGYERGWGAAFDPIAMRLQLDDQQRALDLSVIPLTIDSDYREWIEITGSKAPEKGALAAHPDARAFFSMAIDPEHSRIREWGTQSSELLPNLKAEPLAWVGDSITVFIDDGFFWKAAKIGDIEQLIETSPSQIPLGMRIDSRSGMRLALFVSAVRAQIEKSAPGLTIWEERKHGEQAYIVIKQAEAEMGALEDLTIYYAAMKNALIITLDEAVLTRAIDREGKQKTTGQHLHASLDDLTIDSMESLMGERAERRQLTSWSAIPILNEWHHFSAKAKSDPGAWHAKMFHEQIHCPGGRGYRWNPEHHTMESVAYGHPGDPRNKPYNRKKSEPFSAFDVSLTFEHDGLRLRGSMSHSDRKPKEAAAEKALEKANAAIEIPEGFPQAADLIPETVGAKSTFAVEGKYYGEETSETLTTSIIHIESDSDGTIIKVRDDHRDNLKENEHEREFRTFRLNGGLHQVSFDTDHGLNEYDPPVTILPDKIAPGITYQGLYDQSFKTDSYEQIKLIQYRNVIKGLETIEVPAGTFKDCLRVDQAFQEMGAFVDGSQSKLGRGTSSTWYAKDVGIVKQTWENTNRQQTMELTKFEPAPADDKK